MDKETTKLAKKFASKVKKKLNPKKIILFGSRARGDNFKASDFDFVIVSEKFEKIPFIKRMSEMYEYWNEKYDLEAICYTPKEFETKSKEHGTIRSAIKEGIEL